MANRYTLRKYWPNSVLLLCTFHILKAVWKWLCLTKNKIDNADRQTSYHLFRNILLSLKLIEMEKTIKKVQDSAMCAKYCQYKSYIQNFINNSLESWCIVFKQFFMTRGTETNNYIEVMSRLFKDISLESTKAYNSTQLADFVVTSFEAYYKKGL